MKSTRWGFLTGLLGVVGVARAQDYCAGGDPPPNQPGCKPVGGMMNRNAGVPTYIEARPAWKDGKTRNNQCPVCGTMAREMSNKITVHLSADGTAFVGTPSTRIVRCHRCNAAFWQDTE